MNLYVTEINAIDNVTGLLTQYIGPYVSAPTWEMAEDWCKSNAGWLHVVGKLEEEIDHPDKFNPIWN